MTKLLIILILFSSTVVGQVRDTTYKLRNEIWNCGNPHRVRTAHVHNGRIRFDWEDNGVSSTKTVVQALAFWKREKTTVKRVIK